MMVLTVGAMLLLFPPLSSSAATKSGAGPAASGAQALSPAWSVTGEVDLSPRASAAH
jgi:hypothetical protein